MSQAVQATTLTEAAKQRFLDALEKEHATTLRVLRAFPADKLDLRPHPDCRSARELAWVFVMERGLGVAVYKRAFQQLLAAGPPPEPPASWEEILTALEHAHRDYAELIRATPPHELTDKVEFLMGPQRLGEISRIDWLWFLLHDEIHHRGQFSIYLRVAGAPVPSIYGPSRDEPWM
jgi:hypothetical protein